MRSTSLLDIFEWVRLELGLERLCREANYVDTERIPLWPTNSSVTS